MLIQFCMTIWLFTGSLHYDVVWLSRGHRARCLLLLLLSVVVITECWRRLEIDWICCPFCVLLLHTYSSACTSPANVIEGWKLHCCSQISLQACRRVGYRYWLLCSFDFQQALCSSVLRHCTNFMLIDAWKLVMRGCNNECWALCFTEPHGEELFCWMPALSR